MDDYVLLITGGNGFLGQHLVREVQLREDTVREIRVVDLNGYEQQLEFKPRVPVTSFTADLRDVQSCESAFQGVDVVLHCAALVTYQFPVDEELLYKQNVQGTGNVIQLCLKNNVKQLIYTSTTEVVLQPYMKSHLALVVNQAESKACPPDKMHDLLLPGLATSKLQAEKLVLQHNGTVSPNGTVLLTASLRPTQLYGELDKNSLLPLLKSAKFWDFKLPRVFGNESKQQITYAGNVAWAHVLAKRTLEKSPEKIAGLPVFITDDTDIEDTLTQVETLTDGRITTTKWWLPAMFAYIAAVMFDLFVLYFLHPVFKKSVAYSGRNLVSYFSSILFFSRLRASLHLDYVPIYTPQEANIKSREYYKKQLSSRFKK